MRKLAILLLLAAGCRGEPPRVVVQHILISFAGASRPQNQRSQEVAEKLAGELLRLARRGEDFEVLMRTYSDDKGPGEYGMSNRQVEPEAGEAPRGAFVPGFGNLAFQLEVDEIALVPYEPGVSPFVWHLLKRVK